MTAASPCCASIIVRKASRAEPSVKDAAARRLAASISIWVSRRERTGREPDRQVPQSSLASAAQDVDRLGDLQRVADRRTERLRHVGDRGGGIPARVARDRETRLHQLPGLAGVPHEGAGARLHIEQDQIGVDRQLLRHHAGGDQWDRSDRRGGVAQRVDGPVGRDEIGGLGGDHAADRRRLIADGVRVEVGAEPRDGLQLVDRAAGVTEAAARDLHARQAERGDQGCEHQGHGVAHTAGRMLVDDRAPDVTELDRASRRDEGTGHRRGLGGIHPLQDARHQERGHRPVRHVPLGIAGDQPLERLRCDRRTGALALDGLPRIPTHASKPIAAWKLSPTRSTRSTPTSRATVAPRSPNVARVPRSCGPPGHPAASSGVRSRE